MFEIPLFRWADLKVKRAARCKTVLFIFRPPPAFSYETYVILGHPPLCVLLEYKTDVAKGLRRRGQGRYMDKDRDGFIAEIGNDT
jgi:hypothetical protein